MTIVRCPASALRRLIGTLALAYAVAAPLCGHALDPALGQVDSKGPDTAMQQGEHRAFTNHAGRVDSPVGQARLSLLEATHHYALGLFDDAHADLQRAAQALDRVATGGDRYAKERARALAHDVRQLADAIGHGEGDAAHTSQQAIDRFLARTAALGERVGTRAYLGSRELDTDDPLKRRLIDAQLHLSYAQIDRLTLHDPASASKELERARGDLYAVLEQLPERLHAELRPLEDELLALLDGLAITNGSPIEAARLRYDLASADLHELETAL